MWPPMQKPIAPIRSPRTSGRARSQAIAAFASAIISSARSAPSSFMPPAMPGVVVAVLDARPRAVEVVRRERHVALARDALGDVADVRVHAEDLHVDEHGGTRPAGLRAREVAAHAAAAGQRDRDAFGR